MDEDSVNNELHIPRKLVADSEAKSFTFAGIKFVINDMLPDYVIAVCDDQGRLKEVFQLQPNPEPKKE